jgi:putative transposase
MPSRNVVKVNVPESYYHVYTRGASKQNIFLDETDYWHFLSLLDRYLSKETKAGLLVRGYQKLNDSVETLAYCLMPNHLHLLLFQINEDGMSRLMHGVMSSYSRYFNNKYGRSGPLFESRYKASRIPSDPYLLHISRYIHTNHNDWIDYPHSSIRAYLYDDVPTWLNKTRIAELFGSSVDYLKFLNDYVKDES